MKTDNLEVIKQVTWIPNELCPAFLEWCIRGGHDIKVKKTGVAISKGKNKGTILCNGKVEPSYLMTDYIVSRFELFSRQWMKYGKTFIEELDAAMTKKCDVIYKNA